MRPVAVDIDGVLANFVKGFTTLCNSLDERMPIVENHAACPSWRMQPWYAKEVDRERVADIIEQAWRVVHQTYTFWRDLEPIAPKMHLRDMARTQPLVFMTRRDGYLAYKQTASWLTFHYGLEEPLLVRVRGGEEKSEWCNKLGINVLVDDSPDYGLEFLKNVDGAQLVKPEYPYNAGAYEGAGKLYGYTWQHPDLGLEMACQLANES